MHNKIVIGLDIKNIQIEIKITYKMFLNNVLIPVDKNTPT